MSSPRRLAAVASAATFVVSLALAARYGFHRDELYIVAMGREPTWGIDHAPLVPTLSHALGVLLGESPLAQRLVAALAGSLLVGVVGLLTSELGGTRRAQAIAMFAVATGPAFIFARGVVGTNVLEQLVWTAVAYALAVVPRAPALAYLAIGALFGLAFANKYSGIALACAFAVGLGVGGRGLRSRWALVGGLVALAGLVPSLVYQVEHGFPARDFHDAHRAAREATASLAALCWQQPFHAHPVTFALAATGVVHALRARMPFGRTLVIATALYVALVALGRGKPYYLIPLYPPLVALGAVALPRALARSKALLVAWIATVPLVVAATLPLTGTAPLREVNKELVQFLDWRALVRELAAQYRVQFPAADGDLLVGSYGTAAAIELYGAEHGLPAPISGANSYFGRKPPIPPPERATRAPYRVLAVGYDEPTLRHFFDTVTAIGELRDPHDASTDNRFDVPRTIYLCRGMKLPLALGWSKLRRYD